MSPANIDERISRKDLVDKALTAAGWRVVSHSRWLAGDPTLANAVEEFPGDIGPADYLLHVDGQPVADVEAKKVSVDPRKVTEQAKCYGGSLASVSARYGPQRYAPPFDYAMNGKLICNLRLAVHFCRRARLSDFKDRARRPRSRPFTTYWVLRHRTQY